MKFFVKFPAGNIMPLEAAESDLIESVKSQIEQQVCIRVHKFALRLGGRLLVAQHTLGHYSIIDGMTLDVAVYMELEIVVRKRVWIQLEDEGSTVLDVKKKLMLEEGHPEHSQHLTFLGTALSDGDRLAEHGIHDTAVLTADIWL